MKVSLKIITSILFIYLSLGATTCPPIPGDYFCITPEMAKDSAIQIFDFYTIPSKILALFSPELEKIGIPVLLDAQWESPYFGAGVSLYKDQFRVMILGGSTRVDDMTLDAYAALVCHELGHILGGSPLQTITGAEWSSAEGQSDYFAASECLPRYFSSTGASPNNILTRVEKAGFEMLWAFRNFDANARTELDRKIVRYQKETYSTTYTLINSYPSLQCRYENFRNPTKRPACWYRD